MLSLTELNALLKSIVNSLTALQSLWSSYIRDVQ